MISFAPTMSGAPIVPCPGHVRPGDNFGNAGWGSSGNSPRKTRYDVGDHPCVRNDRETIMDKKSPVTPPIAARRPHSFTRHGITIVDNYAWLKDENWQEVLRD